MEAPKYAESVTHVLNLDAGSDRNGNPRRVAVLYDKWGTILDALDHGYAGHPRWLRDATASRKVVSLGSFVTSPAERRELLRMVRDR